MTMSKKTAKDEALPKGKTVIRTEIAPESGVLDNRAAGLVQLIQSWIDEGGADEQRETLEYLIRRWMKTGCLIASSFRSN